jgi:hypothetical protein
LSHINAASILAHGNSAHKLLSGILRHSTRQLRLSLDIGINIECIRLDSH